LVKSPKVYVRDSGLLHALLDIADHDALVAIRGWRELGRVRHESGDFGAAPDACGFYRTSVGAGSTCFSIFRR
jgi:hypothetical protein